MNFLADTQAFIWWAFDDGLLSRPATAALEERRRGGVFFSIASAWEIAIKVGLGRLSLPATPAEVLALAERSGFIILGITAGHVQAVADLPQFPNHRDPFDRMLIAQAQVEGVRIITIDEKFGLYDVPRLW